MELDNKVHNCVFIVTTVFILLTGTVVFVVLVVWATGGKIGPPGQVYSEQVVKVDCGISSLTLSDLAIKGATAAPRNGHPWHAAVFSLNDPTLLACDATLVAANWVITGGQCFLENLYNLSPSDYSEKLKIVLGAWDLSQAAQRKTLTVDVKRVLIDYESYEKPRLGDLALIELKSAVNFESNPWVRPACLPHSTEAFFNIDQDQFLSVGWDQENPEQVLQVGVKMEYSSVCQERLSISYPDLLFEPLKTMCSIDKDVCKPGSGGSLLYANTSTNPITFTLIGVNSWGLHCSARDNARVRMYSSLIGHRAWWEDIMKS